MTLKQAFNSYLRNDYSRHFSLVFSVSHFPHAEVAAPKTSNLFLHLNQAPSTSAVFTTVLRGQQDFFLNKGGEIPATLQKCTLMLNN